MLQFILQENEHYSMPELAQMAIEGGCKWIQLRPDDMDEPSIRALGTELVPLCRETGVILTIENNLDMAKELGLHGVHLRHSSISAPEARQLLGPEAIVGVEVEIASQVMAIAGADIDYATFAPTLSIERIGENIEALRNAHVIMPLVAEGDFHTDEIRKLLALGINGIAMGRNLADAPDPTEKIAETISVLTT